MKKKAIKSDTLLDFTRQLATLLKTGIPLITALDILQKDTENTKLKKLIQTIIIDVSAGEAFSSSLKKHGESFDKLFCQLIKIGEETGQLDTLLEKIAEMNAKNATLKKQVKAALMYPMIVLGVSLIITIGILIFVVPQFQKLFEYFNADLPIYTKIVLHLSSLILHQGLVFCLMIGTALYLINHYKNTSKSFARKIDQQKLRLPIVGKLQQYAIISRTMYTFAITYNAGLPIDRILSIIVGVSNNLIYEASFEMSNIMVKDGTSLSEAMRAQDIFPSRVTQMVTIGEQSGSLGEMLQHIATDFERQVQHITNQLGKLIEPVMMLILGMVIGGLMGALYLPIFQLGNVI